MKFQDISITIDGKELLKNFSKTIAPGETVVVIGPNGCGKSTFAHGIMGRDDIELEGSIQLNHKEITDMETFERSQEGLFVSWQTPPELPGVSRLTNPRTKISHLKILAVNLQELKGTLTKVDTKHAPRPECWWQWW